MPFFIAHAVDSRPGSDEDDPHIDSAARAIIDWDVRLFLR